MKTPWRKETIQLTKKRTQLNLFDADGQSMCIITGGTKEDDAIIAEYILAAVNASTPVSHEEEVRRAIWPVVPTAKGKKKARGRGRG